MKKLILFLFLFGCVAYCSRSCGEDDDSSMYDEEYWSSVAREKQMRKAGFKEFADREKRERQARLRNMKNNPPIKVEKQEASTPPQKVETKPLFCITSNEDIFLLDKPKGNKILNEEATKYFGKETYFRIGELDNVIILEEKDGWAKVQHAQFPLNQGWIKKSHLKRRNKSHTERVQRGLNDYKGSKEQQEDLKAIDEYMKTHPDF
jgi:hypothetical protein|nr:MAG TPA: protein of unknown function DUF5016 [Bacteriophage sp.]